MTPPDNILQKGARMTIAFNREDTRIIQDPKHPNRICVTILGAYGMVVRAINDEHSQWETISLKEWDQQRPTTAPASR